MSHQGKLETHWSLHFDTRRDAELAQEIANKFDELCYTEIIEGDKQPDGTELKPGIRLEIWYHDRNAPSE